ncbi:glycosyltransferase family 2 protein [candidate division KSB1 bacterium]|nr:glycosyltransferase family 2 protein [candidate division KSB1 bacterium]NIR68858.1 glycosyltransferase family 2 protein [candidate division KSB1 bacterium]NIS27226.1 glycosyltransferase family 2 protein [candidate division KSB1 bacterium]NIT74111.1 glycosyltransferase family 2 protein [candidate division KSB1 bacterium]NIU27960.1 glycosyltransferase family 2 protein [candidate division KSB1 bacterium]
MTKTISNQPVLSIIIVNWNTGKLLRQCIQSVHRSTHKTLFEIWVIDNGSTDGSIEMMKTEYPKVNLVANNLNLGFSKANNFGIGKSTGRFVCLMNTDVEVLDGCLDQLSEFLKRNPKAGLVGPRILNRDKSLQISCYGHPTFWNGLCYGLGLDQVLPRSNRFGGMYRKYWPYDRLRPVDVVSGCLCVAKRDAMDEVGPLDEDFFMYMEDFDWCKRFAEKGWEVYYAPEAQAIHFGGGSSSDKSENYWIERNRAMARYWKKHHGFIGKGYILSMIFLRHLLRTIQGLIWYVLKPSQKVTLRPKIKESVASLHWLLGIRASK